MRPHPATAGHDTTPARIRLPLRLLLAFSPADAERRFAGHYQGFYHRYAQAALVLGLLLVLGDYVVDRMAHPGVPSNLMRVTVTMPLLGLAAAYTFLPGARRHWQPVLAGLLVAVAASLFWILLRMDAEGGPGLRSWVGVLNFTFLEFYCFVILGIQFRIALVAGCAILAGFVGALGWHPGSDLPDVVYWAYHVVTVFVLAAAIGWWREYVLRSEFMARLELQRAREAAELLARTKSEFLASMSHEIRTPLNGVLGMTELLIDSGLAPHQRAWAETVRDSGRHLLGLINDVLDVSKIEAGGLTLESMPFDLEDVVMQSVAMFAQPAAAKGLRLSGQVAPEAALTLRGDPLRLRQVVANLVSNAVKFTEQGRVEVNAALLGVAAGVAQVRITVADTGIGIAPEAHGRIFEQFSQADSSTTRRYGGTGLGLAICRQLTEAMGGQIHLESELGEGACFIVELQLPLADALPVAVPGAAVSPRPWAHGPAAIAPDEGEPAAPAPLHGRVLLVDDDPINLAVAAAMLRKLGLEPALADGGQAGVAQAAQHAFDLVLMDCQMPEMDGYRAATAIRQLPAGQGAAVPIIALTAHTTPGDIERCLAAGMNACLAKPFKLDALRAQLGRWLPVAQST